jgi:hypothetical protein
MGMLDALRRLAQQEDSQNQGMQDTTTWTTPAREAYETERARLRAEQDKKRS